MSSPESKSVEEPAKAYAEASDLFSPIEAEERQLKSGKWIKVKRLPLRRLGLMATKAGQDYTLLAVLTILESVIEPKLSLAQIDQMTQDQFAEIFGIVSEINGRTKATEEKAKNF